MPLGLDFLQRIVNVHWGGIGEFAVGGTVRDATQEGPIGVFYSKKTEPDDPSEWGHTHMDPGSPEPPPATDHRAEWTGGGGPRGVGLWFNNIVSMVGGKIKAKTAEETDKKILVAAGFRAEMIGLDNIITSPSRGVTSWHYNYQTTALLFWSDDNGKTWTEVPCPVTAPPGQGQPNPVSVDVQMLYVAFDPKTETFYGDVSKGGVELAAEYIERTLISSKDGKAWSIEESVIHDRTGGIIPAAWTSPFLAKIPSIKNNGLTEVISTDAEPEVTLTYKTIEVLPNPSGGNLKLAPPWKMKSMVDPDKDPEDPVNSRTVTGIAYGERTADGESSNKGFAYANGRFLIAGSLMATFDNTKYDVLAYSSTDGGETWVKTLNDKATFKIADQVNNEPDGCAGSCGCAGA